LTFFKKLDFILKWVYEKKIKIFEFNHSDSYRNKTDAAPLGCEILTTNGEFEMVIFCHTIYFRIKSIK